MNSITIIDFNKESDISNWLVVNDVVMGGNSSALFYIDNNGNGVFKGNVSLENNGGFSSVRYQFNKINVQNSKKIKLHLKGDGKTYRLRIKANKYNRYSYTANLETNNKWQVIEISLKEMQPVFRGTKLDMSNFSENSIEEIGILIGNKKNESFKLIIDKIELH